MLSLEHGIQAILVTPESRIFEVELELDEPLTDVLQVIAFRDVTQAQNLSKHNPGTGWGWGAMALEAQRRLSDTSTLGHIAWGNPADSLGLPQLSMREVPIGILVMTRHRLHLKGRKCPTVSPTPTR